MIIQRILQLGVLCGIIHLFVYGSTKPPSPPRMTMARPAARPPEPPPAGADMVIVGAGTNETWCFAPPDGATVVETWRRRGAANERVAVGCPHPVDGPMSIDTCGRVTTPRRVYSPLGRQLGMVPEARWADIGRESLAWWTVTASNSTVVCWQNALLGRDTNTPVSVRAEFFADGRFEYRYDRSTVGECVTSLRGELIGEIVSWIAADATNETQVIVADELKSTKLWGQFAFAADPGTNALYSRTFEIDRRNGWTSCFISGRGDAALCTCGADAIGEWSLDGLTVEWEDDTGLSGTADASPEDDSWYLPAATNATRVTIRLMANADAERHASPTLYLLEYSPRLDFSAAQEVEGDGGKTYLVYTDAADMSLSVDESNRPCRAPAGGGEATANDFAMPTEPGVYKLPTGELAEPDQRPRLLAAPRLGTGSGGAAFSDIRGIAFATDTTHIYTRATKKPLDESQFYAERADLIPDMRQLKSWVRKLPRPIAVFCCNDLRAIQLQQVARGLGLRVPEDLAILGVDDDTVLCSFAEIPTSSINPNSRQVGYDAARLLRAMMIRKPANKLHRIRYVRPGRIIERTSTDFMPVDPPWLGNVLLHIERNMRRPITASEIFALSGRSSTFVENVFRDKLHTSAQAYITSVKMREAKRHLNNSNLRISEIAYLCGYDSPAYFCRIFTSTFGASPRTYREQSRR